MRGRIICAFCLATSLHSINADISTSPLLFALLLYSRIGRLDDYGGMGDKQVHLPLCYFPAKSRLGAGKECKCHRVTSLSSQTVLSRMCLLNGGNGNGHVRPSAQTVLSCFSESFRFLLLMSLALSLGGWCLVGGSIMLLLNYSTILLKKVFNV